MVRALLFLYAESPVHAGADSALGDLDLPIQREAGTGLPVIWGQSLKGALRSHARARWGATDQRITRLFGDAPPGGGESGTQQPATASGEPRSARPGSLSVGDAHLVAFPAPTLLRTFAWVTSPLALGRLRRRLPLVEHPPAPQKLPEPTDATASTASGGWAAERTALGPYVLAFDPDETVQAWAKWLADAALPAGQEFEYFRAKLGKDLVMVSDELLTSLTHDCAEVTPRVQLEEDRKVVRHGPFHTEYLPAETVLVSLLEAADAAALRELGSIVTGQVLHVGGDETIGKGLVWGRLLGIGDARVAA